MSTSSAVKDVVSELIRAAAGSSAKDVSDQDVDKYVADLILKEAEAKKQKYNVIGVQAYKADKPKPKPNTRFLLNVVKGVDTHNQAVIKANEDNVAKLRSERLERELEEFKKQKRAQQLEDEKNRSDSDRIENGRSRRDYDKEDRHRSSSRHHPHHSSSSHKSRRGSRHEHKSSSKHEHNSSSSRHERKSSKQEKKPLDHIEIQRSSSPSSLNIKGRGKSRMNESSMDRYFKKGYDPLFDIDSDPESYVYEPTTTKRKHKEKSKKKSKKRKREHSIEKDGKAIEASSSVRAWDVGKKVV